MLGIWWQDTEGAKFWLAVLNDLHQRGVEDVLIACVDGLTGFPEAIEAVFPQAWVQTCIVHQIRASMRYVSYQRPQARSPPTCARSTPPPTPTPPLDRARALRRAVGRALPDDRRRPGARAGSTSSRSSRCPTTCAASSTPPTRIESLHRQIRKAIKTRGHFPDEQAATKLIYLAIERAETKWRSARAWTAARAALKIHFGDRFPD